MTLPPAVIATRDRYVHAFPLWTMPEGQAAEDKARRWTIGLAEQICYEHGPSYGNKRADPNRPISKDAIAYVPGILPWNPGEKLYAFDMLTGAGSGAPQLVPNPEGQDISNQVFVTALAVDHLAGQPPVPVPPPVSSVVPYDENKSIQFGLACNDVYQETDAPVDPGMISVQSQRAAWDHYVGGMPWSNIGAVGDADYVEGSMHKHINELRSVYNLPQLP